MEKPDDKVILQSFRRTLSAQKSADIIGSEAGREQQDEPEPESDRETPNPGSGAPVLALIEFRIQNLYNRRQFLLQMQQFRKKTENNSEQSTEEKIGEDAGDLCELEAIQKELEELLVQKEATQKQRKSSDQTANGGTQQNTHPTCYKAESPRGGIYMLPLSQMNQEDTSLEQTVQTTPAPGQTSGSVVPADSLGQTSAVTHCPSCEEVVFTETRRTFGETVWVLCCLCSMLGCVAGCCLVPFFVDRWKNVRHQCPQCQAHIHTSQPF